MMMRWVRTGSGLIQVSFARPARTPSFVPEPGGKESQRGVTVTQLVLTYG